VLVALAMAAAPFRFFVHEPSNTWTLGFRSIVWCFSIVSDCGSIGVTVVNRVEYRCSIG
jgi:hypothetical protein